MGIPVIITRKVWSGTSNVRWATGNMRLPAIKLYFAVTSTEMCFTQSSCTKVIMHIKEKDLSNPERKGFDPDVPYNFMIGGDGWVYEGRGWTTAPRIPSMYNKKHETKSLLIAFMGGFRRTPPSFKMFDARDDLVQYGIDNGYISDQYIPTDIR